MRVSFGSDNLEGRYIPLAEPETGSNHITLIEFRTGMIFAGRGLVQHGTPP